MSLHDKIAAVRRRLFWVVLGAGLLMGVTALLVFLLCSAWLDLVWELSAAWRLALLGCAVVLLVAVPVVMLALAARQMAAAAIARAIDQVGAGGGAVLTGLEFSRPQSGQRLSPLGAGLASLAVQRASRVAAGVPVAAAVPLRPLKRASLGLGAAAGVIALVAVLMPDLARSAWQRFAHPSDDTAPFAWTNFNVTPSNARLLYGSEFDVIATSEGEPVEHVELVLQSADSLPPLPMFPEGKNRWRVTVARVTSPGTYYVRSAHARSDRHRLDLITVPQLEKVRFRVQPPSYAKRGRYDGPLPRDGLAGLHGTTVTVWAQSNRPLAGGTLSVTSHGATQPVALRPSEDNDREVTGEFTIAADGRFELRVTDRDGQTSQQSLTGPITLLADQRPFIRLLQPKPNSLATPTTLLPVEIAAEDDCGVLRVQLFRNLNDSRPLPGEVDLKGRTPRRVTEPLYLPLKDYGLEPGDTIRLFGRVEDNDPRGAKGTESSVVSVRIISQEEFERMMRTRHGLEMLLAKYREGQRRLESGEEELDRLRKKIEGAKDDQEREEARAAFKRLARRMKDDAENLRRAAQRKLPYDLDKEMTPQLERLASEIDEWAEEIEKLERETKMSTPEMQEKLKKLAARVGAKRKSFDDQVARPMEHLAAIFPLMADQMKFVTLVAEQQDLAERLAGLKGRDGEDQPALKARMRDLEQEQRALRMRLEELLDEIENHAKQLPDDPKLDPLRQTAQEFVEKVRASGAGEAQAAAETALSEFHGTRAHENAKKAADILIEFINQCQSLGGMAGGCLVFQPSLAQSLGNTVGQLLADMGSSGSGGYGVYGNTGLQGGLYGNMSGEGDLGANERRKREGDFAGGDASGEDPDELGRGESLSTGTSGAGGQGITPPHYRRRVGQYFQRVLEEAGGQ